MLDPFCAVPFVLRPYFIVTCLWIFHVVIILRTLCSQFIREMVSARARSQGNRTEEAINYKLQTDFEFHFLKPMKKTHQTEYISCAVGIRGDIFTYNDDQI